MKSEQRRISVSPAQFKVRETNISTGPHDGGRSDLLEPTLEIAREAGLLLLEKFNSEIEIGLKGGEEIVTEADRASERLLHDRLTTLLPGSSFFGEETGYTPGDSEMTWVVDPLDGTQNYSLEIPIWGISIGLLDESRCPLLGVLHFPTFSNAVWATLGGGAIQNGEPIRVSDAPLDPNSVIGVQSRVRTIPFPGHIEKACARHCARGYGSIAYHAVLVATGRMRACLDLKVKLHDIAAATLIVREAGGIALDLDSKPIFPLSLPYEQLEGRPIPFFAGDGVTGPDLLQFLFPDGAPL